MSTPRLAFPVTLACLLALSTLTPGCGGARGAGGTTGSLAEHDARPLAQFPSRERLEQVSSAAPRAGSAPAPTTLYSGAWTLAGPFPDDDARAPASPSGAIEAIAHEEAARIARPVSRAVDCGAREIARFLVEHDTPDQRVAQFALARCGSTAELVWADSIRAPLGAPMDDATFLATYGQALRERTRARFAELAEHGVTHVAMRVERSESVAVAAIVGVVEQLDLTTRAPRVEGDGIVLRGRLAVPAARLEAYVTFGPADFARCAVSREVALPEVAIRCPMHLSDTLARVEVMAFAPERVLGSAVGRVLLRRGAADGSDPSTVLAALPVDASLAGADASPALVEALLARANALRAETGRAPLSLELAQSAAVQGLVPSWLDAMLGGRADVAEEIALGVMAGWDVSGGTIRDARLGSTLQAVTRHPGEWLALLMEDPWTRAVLLDPEMRGAALGVRWDAERQAFVGVLSTYAFFEGADLERARESAMRALVEARAARGLPAPSFVGNVPGMPEAVEQVRRGSRSPGQALDAVMRHTASRAPGRRVQALLMEATSPEALAWPEELVGRRELRLGVGLAWHRVPGAAWGQYAAMVIVLD